jgi:hypothetical protein
LQLLLCSLLCDTSALAAGNGQMPQAAAGAAAAAAAAAAAPRSMLTLGQSNHRNVAGARQCGGVAPQQWVEDCLSHQWVSLVHQACPGVGEGRGSGSSGLVSQHAPHQVNRCLLQATSGRAGTRVWIAGQAAKQPCLHRNEHDGLVHLHQLGAAWVAGVVGNVLLWSCDACAVATVGIRSGVVRAHVAVVS